MKKLPFLFAAITALFACNKPTINNLAVQTLEKNRVVLPNGWALTPAPESLPLGDLPLHMVLSKDKTRMLVTNNGQSTQSLTWIDVTTNRVLHDKVIPKSWLGIALTGDAKTVYASGGNDNVIRMYQIVADTLLERDSLVLGKPWPAEKISPAGIALDEARQRLYVVTKEDSALYVLNTQSKTVVQKLPLGTEAYTCLLSNDAKSLYISLWGNAAVAIVDTEKGIIRNTIKVGLHPNDMTLTKDGRYLYVACADDNAVSVVDLQQQKVVETMITSLYPNAPTGSTTNGVALSEDEKTLFIANADNNCLAVFDVEKPGNSHAEGFIPTGWYPTSVKVAGNKILVANGKGFTSLPNPKGPQPYMRQRSPEYIGGLFKGTLSTMTIPDEATLAAYSQLVYKNAAYSPEKSRQAHAEKGNPIPQKVGAPSPIKYVFYIIKENRTYDQVLGDLKEGNGDPSLCLFPDSITPNQHALAREFVLLDNFYVNAEVSADGHNWSMAAYANDFVEKTWPTSYGGRGGNYDYEGSRKIAYPKLGFIWDFCQRAGVSYRTYGEFSNLNETYLKSLEGHTAPNYPGYDLSIKDTLRFNRFVADFDSLLKINKVPRFNTVRFGNDHTAGARAGIPTPAAMVADNDLAVGMFVEYISKSSIWKETAIFILEDDAQNGPDHVDAHRSIAFVVSPYTKRRHKESSIYGTTSMLRTMELILGLPPMSQYDAGATPMHACFTATPDFTPFKARPNRVDLNELNKESKLSGMSYQLNLDKEDQAPDNLFSEIIWKAVRGEHAEMPAPRRSAFVRVTEEE
jgi:DNA-binding beta-propeller fold protein YncE